MSVRRFELGKETGKVQVIKDKTESERIHRHVDRISSNGKIIHEFQKLTKRASREVGSSQLQPHRSRWAGRAAQTRRWATPASRWS
jgi:hypothetical protein